PDDRRELGLIVTGEQQRRHDVRPGYGFWNGDVDRLSDQRLSIAKGHPAQPKTDGQLVLVDGKEGQIDPSERTLLQRIGVQPEVRDPNGRLGAGRGADHMSGGYDKAPS